VDQSAEAAGAAKAADPLSAGTPVPLNWVMGGRPDG